MTKSIAIGIDLGTTNSCVGIWKDNHVEIIENDINKRLTPSYVSLDKNKRFIGDEALNKVKINPRNTVFNIKRLIGRTAYDKNVQPVMKYWPFKITKYNGRNFIETNYKDKPEYFTAEEISSMIISKLKESAENYLGHKVTDAVISVPAYFNDAQRRATMDAGTIAGLNVLRIINETSATAITYGLNNGIKEKENILVIDLGGGTYDVSLITINNGKYKVKATSGDTNLGGEDFNNRLIDYFINEIKGKYHIDIFSNPKSLMRLRSACEKAKCVLSSFEEAPIEIEYLIDGNDFQSIITRSCFEEICSDLFERILPPIDFVLQDSKFSKFDINEIMLTGGSTRIPKIRKIISSYFNNKKINKTINIDEAVACGAAVQAFIFSGKTSEITKNLKLIDVIPYSIKIPNYLDIKCNSLIPYRDKISENYKFKKNETNHQFLLYEEDYFKASNTLNYIQFTIPPLYWRKVSLNIEFCIDINGITNLYVDVDGVDIYNYQYFNYRGNLTEDNINHFIMENEKYKESYKNENERLQYMNDLENTAYQIRTQFKDKKIIYKNFSAYLNKLSEDTNSTLEWLKNNKNASKKECEKRKLELEKFSEPLKFLMDFE